MVKKKIWWFQNNYLSLQRTKNKTMSKIFYTVEVDIDFIDEFDGSLTGNKTVSVYEIKNGDMSKIVDLDLTIPTNSEEAIQDWMDDNGYGDKKIEIILL